MENNIFTYTVQPDDIDLSGLSTIPSLYRKVIGAIGLNIRNEGYGIDVMSSLGLTWALARCGIEFKQRPALYSELTVSVFKGNDDDLSHGRNIEIRDSKGELIGCGSTDWCVLDKGTRRPVISNLESPLEAKEVACVRPRRLLPFKSIQEVSCQAGYSECDFNGHLNNCRYVDWFFNLIPDRMASLKKPVRLDINFKNEIPRGSKILASVKQIGRKRVDFCLRQSGAVACLASLSSI